MTRSAIRITACAGLLTAGLLVGGIGGGVAAAEPGGTAGHGGGGANTSAKGGDNKPNRPGVRIGARQDRGAFEIGPGGTRIRFGPRGIRGGFDLGPVSERFGLGPRGFRVTADAEPRWPRGRSAAADETAVGTYSTVDSGDESRSERRRRDASDREGGIGRGARHHQLTIRIPVPQVFNGYGLPDNQPQNKVATVVFSVSTGGVVRVYVEPPPEPTPAPGFRIQGEEDEPPVVEPVSRGGGSDFTTGDPQPLELPAVVAPPPMLVSPPSAPPAVRPGPPQAGSGPGAPAQVPGSPAVPGGGTPPIVRGGPPEPAPPSATGAGPRATPATRMGYERYLRTAQLAEILAVALPGVAGLFFMTFSGGVIGYRQANASRMLRRDRLDRFLP